MASGHAQPDQYFTAWLQTNQRCCLLTCAWLYYQPCRLSHRRIILFYCAATGLLLVGDAWQPGAEYIALSACTTPSGVATVSQPNRGEASVALGDPGGLVSSQASCAVKYLEETMTSAALQSCCSGALLSPDSIVQRWSPQHAAQLLPIIHQASHAPAPPFTCAEGELISVRMRAPPPRKQAAKPQLKQEQTDG